MSEQDELSKDLQAVLIKYLSECLVGGAVPLELAEIRAGDFVAKAKPIIGKQERERIRERIATLSKTNWTDGAQREEILKELNL